MRKTKSVIAALLTFILVISINKDVSALPLSNTEDMFLNDSEICEISSESEGNQTYTSSARNITLSTSDEQIDAAYESEIEAENVTDSTIKLNKNTLALNSKGTNSKETLSVMLAGEKSSVIWTTSDPRIATVSKGIVKAKRPGTVTITATANGVSDSCEVTVVNTFIKLNKTAVINALENDTVTLVPKVSGLREDIKWKSSNTKIATVDEYGVVTAVKHGKTKITAKANGLSASCTLTVNKPTLKLNTENISLYTGPAGNKKTVKAIATGKSKNVKWTSLNTGIASVDKKGRVTAKGEGTTVISATANGLTKDCIVNVIKSNITLDKESITLEKDYTNNSKQLTATVTGYSKSVKWKSSNTEVATVSKGNVVAKGVGNAIITATANGEEAICRVLVTDETHVHNYVHVSYSEVSNVCLEDCIETLKCIECEEEKQITIPAKGSHTYKVQREEATCSIPGYKKLVCELCGQEGEITEVPAIGHKETDWIVDREPTCTEKGARHKSCTVCKNIIVEGEIPTIEHEYEAHETTPENPCTDNVYALMKCKNCDESYVDYEQLIKEASHDYELITEDATEEADGREYEKCRVCGEIASDRIIPRNTHEHNLVTEIVKESTCVEKGSQKTYCTKCDFEEYEEIAKKPHKFGDPVVEIEATCMEAGLMQSKCVCGITWGTRIPATGEHIYELISSSEAINKCTDVVINTYKCKNCSDSYNEEVLPPGHFYMMVTVTEATYENAGLKREECYICGQVKPGSEAEIPKLVKEECKHPSYTKKLTEAATCVTYAQYQKICDSCGDVIGTTRGISFGDHIDVIKEETKAPSYSMEGEYTYRCTVCGSIVKKETIPKLTVCSHNTTVYYVDFGDGTRGVYCSECDYLIRKENTSEPICYHKTTKQVMNTAPTSTTNGIVDVVCAGCGKKMSTQTIHAYSTYTVDIGGGQTTTVCGYFDDTKAQEVFQKLNEYRVSKGLHALNWAPKLDSAARLRVVESAYLFSHTRPNRQLWWQIDAVYLNGENLASGYTTSTSVMAGWKASPGHDENMLYSDFKSVNTTCFVRLIFGTDPNRLTPTQQTYFWAQEFSCYPEW